MPLAAHNPTDRVEQLILLTERLTGILSDEIDVLQSRRPREMAGYDSEKSKLASIYAQEIRAIAKDKALVAGVAPELTDRLKNFTQNFEAKAKEQKSLLDRAKRLSEGAIKAIADELVQKQDQPSAYGRKAARNEVRGAAPLALNEVV